MHAVRCKKGETVATIQNGPPAPAPPNFDVISLNAAITSASSLCSAILLGSVMISCTAFMTRGFSKIFFSSGSLRRPESRSLAPPPMPPMPPMPPGIPPG
eukprot:Polyplicarium_translucidae@DN432_c1_g1_i1.p1